MARALVLAALAALLPLAALAAPAAAEGCEANVVIFSRANVASTGLVPALNPSGPACALAPDADPAWTRLILPASDEVRVRYLLDVGRPTLPAVLDGLGFDAFPTTLARTTLVGGAVAYDSPYLPIPGGPTAQGKITATVLLPGGGSESVTFRTV